MGLSAGGERGVPTAAFGRGDAVVFSLVKIIEAEEELLEAGGAMATDGAPVASSQVGSINQLIQHS